MNGNPEHIPSRFRRRAALRPAASSEPRIRGHRGFHAAVSLALTAVVLSACSSGGTQKAADGKDAASNAASAPASKAPKAAPLPSVPPVMAPAWKTPRLGKDAAKFTSEDFDPRNPKNSKEARDGLIAAWPVGDRYFVGRGTGVEIYQLATGQRIGTVAAPKPGLQPCGMTPGLNKDGIGAVAWWEETTDYVFGACRYLSVVDARNGGKVLSTSGFASAKKDGSPLSVYNTQLGFVGDDLVAATTLTSVVAFRVSDGGEAWTWRNRTTPETLVSIKSMATSPDTIAVLADASPTPMRQEHELVTLDRNGRQIGAAPTPLQVTDPTDDAELLSMDPLTVITKPESGFSRVPALIHVFDRAGAPKNTPFPLKADQGPIDVNADLGQDSHKWFNLRVTRTTLYATTTFTMSDGGGIDGVVAFDMNTGALRWSRPGADSERPHLALADDDRLLVVNTSSRTFLVDTYAAADGQVTPVSKVELKDPSQSLPSAMHLDFADNRLLVSALRSHTFGTEAFAAAG
ncbi:hypothetical protein GCM10023205_44260 [Yinghuangia aomiensis]|uniref:PQQ-like domain-containing protein n=1 Tax=Yinghuangia aomiensis TaxID=676205 RepID=A0ABP9HKH0_9ACTN